MQARVLESVDGIGLAENVLTGLSTTVITGADRRVSMTSRCERSNVLAVGASASGSEIIGVTSLDRLESSLTLAPGHPPQMAITWPFTVLPSPG